MYDWVIPGEWNINDAWIKDENGEKLIDFKNNNLHVINYSSSINKKLKWGQLKAHLNFSEKFENAIPYITSYYKKSWGFCLSKKQYSEIEIQKEQEFSILIDSEIKPGSLTCGDYLIPGKSKKEILIACYICHPSMANDSLSGIILTAFLAKYINENINNYWSYRIVFVPETIGAISYCFNNESAMKNIDHGLVITTVGGPGKFGYKQSWDEKNILNQLCKDIFVENQQEYITYPFDIHGSDERQYSSPGFRINTVTITKDKYYEYPEYHTSLDNLDFVNGEQIFESFQLYCELIKKIELQVFYINKASKCETMLSKHDLYNFKGGSLIPNKKSKEFLDIILWVLFLSDGKHSIEQIQKKLEIDLETLQFACSTLIKKNLIYRL